MKRIKQRLSKLRRKQPDEKLDSRITNETVAEHREQILAGGRRFKYPVQYSRHKLVINSLLIGTATILVAALTFWWLLYPAQNSSKFMYRLTQIIPVPVATVDGENVPYSRYLQRFRSSIHYLQEQNGLNVNSKDGKKEVEYRKRVELDNAIRDAYATKLARQHNVTVTSKEVDSFIVRDLENKKVSERAYEKNVLNSYYDWSMGDYRDVVRAELLKRKVMFAVDTAARVKATRVQAALRAPNADFAAIAKAESDDEVTKANGGDSGDVPLKTLDTNGIIAAASSMNPGQITELVHGTDGYYIAKVISKNDKTVHYQVIKISLTAFDNQLAAIKKSGKIKEFITISEQKPDK